jgi:hypothetical protein
MLLLTHCNILEQGCPNIVQGDFGQSRLYFTHVFVCMFWPEAGN